MAEKWRQQAKHEQRDAGHVGHRKKMKHTKAHPGFEAVQERIASKEGVSMKAARAILAKSSRGASAAAKRKNPRLRRV